MQRILSLGFLLAAATAATLPAQVNFEQCGRLDDMEVTGFVRERDANGVPVSVGYAAVFSRDDFRGWGWNPTQPETHAIDGVRVLLGDVDPATGEEVDIFVFPESTLVPGSPDLENPAAAWSFPVFGGGGDAAEYVEFVFPEQALVSTAGNVYIEVFMDAFRAAQLRMAILDGFPNDLGRPYDISNSRTGETGHGLGTTGGYTLLLPQAEFGVYQAHIMPVSIEQAGLALTATTTQASLPSSNAPDYTTSFFSALQPCAVEDRLGNAREDNVGWFFRGPFGPGDLVLLFFAPIDFGVEDPVSLDLFLPTSIGSVCLNLAAPLNPVATLNPNILGEAELQLTIPNEARLGMQGFTFVTQAIAGDTANMRLHATGCVAQEW